RGPSDRSDSAQSVVVPRVVLGRPAERAVASVREVARVPDLGLGVCRAHASARFLIRRGHLPAADGVVDLVYHIFCWRTLRVDGPECGVPRRDLSAQLCAVLWIERVLETLRQSDKACAAVRAGKSQVVSTDRFPDGADNVVRADRTLALRRRVRSAPGVPAPAVGWMVVYLRPRGSVEQYRLRVGRRGQPRRAVAHLPAPLAELAGPAHAIGRGSAAPRTVLAARAVAVEGDQARRHAAHERRDPPYIA